MACSYSASSCAAAARAMACPAAVCAATAMRITVAGSGAGVGFGGMRRLPSTARAKPRSVCARACGKQGRARAAGVGLSKKQGKREGDHEALFALLCLSCLSAGWLGLGLFLFDLSAWAWAGLQRLEVAEGQHGHARDLRLDLLAVRQRLGGVRAWVPAGGW